MIPVTDNELKPQMNERDKKVVREIENFAERIDEDNWGILDWKIIDKSREILQKISGSEVEKC